MTSATDELRRLLDERGVKWFPIAWNPKRETFYHAANGVGFCADEYTDGVKIYTDATITPEQAVEATMGPRITGDTSDGYHTFNELYHHRAVLFSVIVRDHNELAWKSKLHHDGTMYDGMFIVGIETPNGQATYHYDVDPYWDIFDCEELERAPEWDGHSPDDAIERISKLGTRECSYEIAAFGDGKAWFQCSECGGMASADHDPPKYCPHCGCKVKED